MADQRLTDKDFISSIEDSDLFHVVEVGDTTANAEGTSKKGLWSLVKSTLKTYFDAFYQPTPSLQPNAVLNGDYFNTTGYEYFVWADLYRINNVLYSTYISDTLTLSTADPTNDRFDIIVINNNGTFSVIEGTAAANPEVPTLSIDTDTQVELVTIRVTANTTSPDGITTRLVYDENVQEAGGEWDTASTGASVILNSAEQAESGTVSIKYNNASNNDAAEFSYSSAFNGSDLSSIKFNIYLPTSDNYRFYVIFALNNVSLSRILVEDGLFGFNESTTASWQTIIIPASSMTDITTGTYDEIGFVNNRNNVTFFIDNVNVQEGATPVGGNNGTVTSVGITGSDGIEVDSGSPITTSGTIALGLNKAATLLFLNIEDGAQVNAVTAVVGLTGGITASQIASAIFALADTNNLTDILLTKLNALALTKHHEFACSDETSDLATGVVYSQRLLRAFTNCTSFDFGVVDAPVGTALDVDVKKNGTTIFTTTATIDDGEFTTITAATPQVISGGSVSFAAGDLLEVEILTVGSTTAGTNLKCQITYNS